MTGASWRATLARSRLRLFVIQVLLVSLFVTLFARLWFVQVLTGAEYRAQAADQSARDVVVQPARGLIVDGQGRPLVANRSSWQVQIDRTLFQRLAPPQQDALLTKLSSLVHVPAHRLRARTLLCSEAGARPATCWNGSPLQPVPVVDDVHQQVALAILEQAEAYPSVLAAETTMRSYPSPYGVNAAHLLGYLSSVSEGELTQARKEHDKSINGASVVGRAGLEREYDEYLRGMPGYQRLAVDSMGRVLGDNGTVAPTPGDTLVTSIDARVQGVVERELRRAMAVARRTVDPVNGGRYKADSGAAVVLDARTGRVVAMASEPTYDPGVWVGGITSKQLKRLYSKKAGTPLLSRATQGEFAPGSTWKPLMSVAALNHGYTTQSRLNCSSGLQVGNRVFKNYESASFGSIDFAQALQISCDTFFYRIGLGYWQRYGSDPANLKAKDPLVAQAKEFGFGKPTGIDLPGESSGRIADRGWKQRYYESQKGYYCDLDRHPEKAPNSYLRRFAHEFCLEGNLYRAGDAVNFSIGQGDTVVTPLQLARAYVALANGGTLYEPRVATAVVSPSGDVVRRIPPAVSGRLKSKKAVLHYLDQALTGTAKVGTTAWKFTGFPLDRVPIRSKTGTAEVYGKQTTSWIASYTKDFVVVMMISQGGTGSGTSGDAVRHIWESLYGVRGAAVIPGRAAIPGVRMPTRLPGFESDGSILPPVRRAS